jgi:hypothetical protein
VLPRRQDRTNALPVTQPRIGPVFALREFPRPIQNFFIYFPLTAIRRQSLRKAICQTVPKINALNAALV